MSYIRRRGMAGVSSQPPGRRISNRALVPLAGVSSQPPGFPVAINALVQFGQLGSLGADTTPTVIDPETRAYYAKSTQQQQQLIEAQRHWAEGDKLQKWIQIGATLSIPLAAAIWRAIGLGRKRRPR